MVRPAWSFLAAGLWACHEPTLPPELAALPSDGGGAADEDVSPPPPLAQLATGDNLALFGVTDDGYVVFTDDDAKTLNVVPARGGLPVEIAQLSGNYVGWVQHNVATVLSSVVAGYAATDGFLRGSSLVWSSAGGAHTLGTEASLAVVSGDSAYAIYLDHVDDQGFADLYGARTDGSSTTLLLGHVPFVIDGAECLFWDTGGSYFVVGYCVGGDAGSGEIKNVSFAEGTWTRADLSLEGLLEIDPTGKRVLTTCAPLEWVPIGGGLPTLVDPAGAFGLVSQDGRSIVYGQDYGGVVKRSPVAVPAPETLFDVATPVALTVMSPDARWIVFSEGPYPGAGAYLASAITPTAPVQLSSTSPTFIASFTNDSSFVLYSPDYSLAPVNSGTLMAAPVRGQAPFVLAENANGWENAHGAKVVVAANYVQLTDKIAKVDLELADPNAPGAPSASIASSVNPYFVVTLSGDQVVYTTAGQSGLTAGLYVAPVR